VPVLFSLLMRLKERDLAGGDFLLWKGKRVEAGERNRPLIWSAPSRKPRKGGSTKRLYHLRIIGWWKPINVAYKTER